MKALISLYNASAESWAAHLSEQAEQWGCKHLDCLFDLATATSVSMRKLRRHPALLDQALLLADSPHSDAVHAGPCLMRFHLQNQTQLTALLDSCNPAPVVLLGTASFAEVVRRLSIGLLAQWDRGVAKGILRYYDPRVVAAVAECLPPDELQFLFGCAQRWQWRDRDGHIAMLDIPVREWRTDLAAIDLQEKHVQQLSAWHMAETWRQDEGLVASTLGYDSEENLLRQLVKAHLAADEASLWQLEPRRRFIAQQLQANRNA